MPHWDNLTPRGRHTVQRVILEGRITNADAHYATLRSLCRRDLLERTVIKKDVAHYHITYTAASDMAGRMGEFCHLYDKADEHVHERALQARANILAGRDCEGFDFKTGEVHHAPLRLIEPDGLHQWAVVMPGEGTLWIDQTYEACRAWIRQQAQEDIANAVRTD